MGIRSLRRAVVSGVLAAVVAVVTLLGASPASAASTQTIRLTTATVLRQSPDDFTRFREVGGVVLRLPGRESLGRVSAVDRTDFSDFPCLIREKHDTITLRFGSGDSLRMVARGSDAAPGACTGVTYHRALSFVITGGTGAFAGARGNGTASGTLRSSPDIDFATVTLNWRGVLLR